MMVASKVFLPAFVATVSASVIVDSYSFTALLKRQEPGTPAYNCHDNCGTAITVVKSSANVCSDSVFLYDYNNCLQCAGPDNYNIWRYYGGTLTSAAEKCGLETTPRSGKQEDVGEAKHAGDNVSSVSVPSRPSSTPSATPSIPESSSALTSNVPKSTVSVTSAPAESTVAVPSWSPVYTGGASTIAKTTAGVSGASAPSTNGTASFTSTPPQQTTNAAIALLPNADMMLGVAIVGVVYGFGN